MNHVEGPACYAHQQRDGCFVDMGCAFEGYECVADDEDDNDKNGYKCHFFVVLIVLA